MKRYRTGFPHVYNANGTRRAAHCAGYLQVVCGEAGVCVRCDTCGEGYRFRFTISGKDLAAHPRNSAAE
jgi:hypothetical protein